MNESTYESRGTHSIKFNMVDDYIDRNREGVLTGRNYCSKLLDSRRMLFTIDTRWFLPYEIVFLLNISKMRPVLSFNFRSPSPSITPNPLHPQISLKGNQIKLSTNPKNHNIPGSEISYINHTSTPTCIFSPLPSSPSPILS